MGKFRQESFLLVGGVVLLSGFVVMEEFRQGVFSINEQHLWNGLFL